MTPEQIAEKLAEEMYPDLNKDAEDFHYCLGNLDNAKDQINTFRQIFKNAFLAGYNYPRWIPVTPETMPEEGESVIVFHLFAREAEWNGEIFHAGDLILSGVTHWQPLPPKPPIQP